MINENGHKRREQRLGRFVRAEKVVAELVREWHDECGIFPAALTSVSTQNFSQLM